MRVWWATLMLACSQPATVDPSFDAGVPPVAVQVGVRGLGRFYVVRGESSQIPFVLSSASASRVTAVSIVGLPPGVTATPTVPEGSAGAVTIHATTDAVVGHVTAVLVTAQGGSGPFDLGVVDVDGSLDPAFGSGGVLALGDAFWPLAGFAVTGGKIWVAGNARSGQLESVHIARFLEDGTPDSAFAGTGSLESEIGGRSTLAFELAVCANGSAFVVAALSNATNTLEYHALRFDQSGASTADVVLPLPGTPGRAACESGALFVTTSDQLVVLGADQTLHVTPLPHMDYQARVVSTSSELYVAATRLAALVETSPNQWGLDATFADGGVLELPGSAQTLSRDANANLLLGLAMNGVAAVGRVRANGMLDPTFADAGVATIGTDTFDSTISAAALGPTSSDVFVSAPSALTKGYAIARVDPTGKLVTTFGDDGVSTIRAIDATNAMKPFGAAFDSQGRLVLLVSDYSSVWIARHRVVAP